MSQIRPRLDLGQVPLPLPLRPVPRTLDRELAERCLAALGGAQSASRELVAAGLLPLEPLTGNTIYLAYHHYDMAGGVYAREQLTLHRPVRIGETLEIGGEIATTYVKRGRRYRIMTSRSLGEDGRAAVTSRSTGIDRYRRHEGEEEGRSAGRALEELPPVGPDEKAAQPNPCGRTLAACRTGDAWERPPRRLTLEMMRVLAGEEEKNPIHTDPEVAKREGLSKPIAGGPHVLAFVQEMLMEELGPQALLYGAHFDVKWVAPVPAGSRLLPRARVRDADGSRLEIDLEAVCGATTAMVGVATLPLASGALSS